MNSSIQNEIKYKGSTRKSFAMHNASLLQKEPKIKIKSEGVDVLRSSDIPDSDPKDRN